MLMRRLLKDVQIDAFPSPFRTQLFHISLQQTWCNYDQVLLGSGILPGHFGISFTGQPCFAVNPIREGTKLVPGAYCQTTTTLDQVQIHKPRQSSKLHQ